jgi:hypothetical protein
VVVGAGEIEDQAKLAPGFFRTPHPRQSGLGEGQAGRVKGKVRVCQIEDEARRIFEGKGRPAGRRGEIEDEARVLRTRVSAHTFNGGGAQGASEKQQRQQGRRPGPSEARPRKSG